MVPHFLQPSEDAVACDTDQAAQCREASSVVDLRKRTNRTGFQVLPTMTAVLEFQAPCLIEDWTVKQCDNTLSSLHATNITEPEAADNTNHYTICSRQLL